MRKLWIHKRARKYGEKPLDQALRAKRNCSVTALLNIALCNTAKYSFILFSVLFQADNFCMILEQYVQMTDSDLTHNATHLTQQHRFPVGGLQMFLR